MPSLADTYRTILEGVLAARTVRRLTATTEVDLEDVLVMLWERMPERDRAAIDPEVVEQLKEKWPGRFDPRT